MERRVVLFIILSITIFVIWQQFIIAPRLEEQKKLQEQQELLREQEEAEKLTAQEPSAPTEILPDEVEPIDSFQEIDLPLKSENYEEKIIDIDTPLYHAKFSTKGGVLLSYRLKDHWDIPRNLDELEDKLQIEKDLEKNLESNLKKIYSGSQVVTDFIALNNIINRIDESSDETIPSDSNFRESLRNFITNAAGKTDKQIRSELTNIKSYLASKIILDDINDRKNSVRNLIQNSGDFENADEALKNKVKIASGVDMVSPLSRRTNRFPFKMHNENGSYDFQYLDFYTDSSSSILIDETNNSQEVKFISTLGKNNAIIITKTFEFFKDSYVFNIYFTIKNNTSKNLDIGNISLDWGPGITYMFGGENKRYTHEGLISLRHGDVEKDLKGTINANWSGIEDSFFTFSMFKEDGAAINFNNKHGVGIPSISLINDINMLLPGQLKEFKIRCYCGPKQISYMRKANVQLERIVDYGWFSFLAIPLLEVMKFFYKYIPNYGFVIILVTLIIRILFYPLNAKSMKSMKKMQELQPKIKELRDKHKNDRQKMNEELMGLYKKYGVNPMGGCLPMLIQIPILFAFFRLLPITIEFRHQPFIFWITDLTAKDPYYVTPILMGLSMIVQQKMTPTSVDPKQAQIMMFLPIIFTFLFLNFSSGLVLYWFTSNLLAIGQQYIMNKDTVQNTDKTKKSKKK